MVSKSYKSKITCLCPVAVKVGQEEVCAPGHEIWGTVTCDTCGDQFNIGPNHIYGSRRTERDCAQSLQKSLVEDHKNGVPHRDWYELRD
jgi:hypothetical protein